MLPEAHRLISLKYYLQPDLKNPWDFYEESQNAANKLAFEGIKLEFGKAHISQQDFIQKMIKKHSQVYYQNFPYAFVSDTVEYGKI
jgi:hypothetical protein